MVYINSAKLAALLAAASSICVIFAHPGEVHDPTHVKREIETLNSLATAHKRSLGLCANGLNARALNDRSIARRAAKAEKLRAVRGIPDSKYITFCFSVYIR